MQQAWLYRTRVYSYMQHNAHEMQSRRMQTQEQLGVGGWGKQLLPVSGAVKKGIKQDAQRLTHTFVSLTSSALLVVFPVSLDTMSMTSSLTAVVSPYPFFMISVRPSTAETTIIKFWSARITALCDTVESRFQYGTPLCMAMQLLICMALHMAVYVASRRCLGMAMQRAPCYSNQPVGVSYPNT